MGRNLNDLAISLEKKAKAAETAKPAAKKPAKRKATAKKATE